MSYATTGLDQIEEITLSLEVSDESLETAASTGDDRMCNYTLGACTGLSVCLA